MKMNEMMSQNWFINSNTITTLMAIFALIGVLLFRKQLLISLLSMELVLLSMFMMMVLMMTYTQQPIALSFYLMILGACEASLGLSLLVTMTRTKGNDMLSMISTNKC